MPTAGYESVDQTGKAIFNIHTGTGLESGTGGCMSFYVGCGSGSAESILVSVSGMHGLTEFTKIEPGAGLVFRNDTNKIGYVYAKSSSATNSVISYAIVAKTYED